MCILKNKNAILNTLSINEATHALETTIFYAFYTFNGFITKKRECSNVKSDTIESSKRRNININDSLNSSLKCHNPDTD